MRPQSRLLYVRARYTALVVRSLRMARRPTDWFTVDQLIIRTCCQVPYNQQILFTCLIYATGVWQPVLAFICEVTRWTVARTTRSKVSCSLETSMSVLVLLGYVPDAATCTIPKGRRPWSRLVMGRCRSFASVSVGFHFSVFNSVFFLKTVLHCIRYRCFKILRGWLKKVSCWF